MALTQVFSAFTKPAATKLNESSMPVVSDPAVDISNPYVGQVVFSTTDTRLYRCSAVVSGVGTWRVFTGGPTWALSRDTAQSVPNNAWTTLNWTVENVDTGNMHPTNGDTVVINQPGLYTEAAKSSWVPNATGIRATRLTLNGTADANTIQGSAVILNTIGTVGVTAVPTPTIFQQHAIADVVRTQGFQNSGGGLNTSVASLGDRTLFTGTWLRD